MTKMLKIANKDLLKTIIHTPQGLMENIETMSEQRGNIGGKKAI